MKNIELLSGDVQREKVKAKNFPYVAFSPKENTVYYTSAPEPDQIIYTTSSGTPLTPNWFRCDLVEMSNTYNDTKTAGCVLFEAPITTINSLQNNSYLTSVIIPEGVETIEEEAFLYCNNLSKIVLPKSIKHIGSQAFRGTKLISGVQSQENIPIYIGNWLLPTIEEYGDPYSADVYTVKYGTVGIGPNTFRNANVNKIYLPDTVKVIDDTAFFLSQINEICLPSALEVIGEMALFMCSSLTSMVIPNSVTSIGYCAFSGCKSLTSIEVAEGNTVYDSRENCNAIIHTATNTLISGCQNTIIPDSVTSIGGMAFYYCSSLSSIVIPDSVTSIGESAFNNCSSLSSIVIPDSVTSIGNNAFSNCSSLSSIVMGNSVTSIDYAAFSYCSKLKSITIPASVTSIGDSAFYRCSKLTSVTINSDTIVGSSRNMSNIFGSQVTEYIIGDSVTGIGDNAFSSCSKLKSVTILNGVASIGYLTFYNCSSLTSITIPNSVTSIGDNAFSSCSRLASVVLTASSEEEFCIGHGNELLCGASVSCPRKIQINGTEVADFTIPNGVVSIGNNAFYNCSSLSSTTIPNSVTSIGDAAFYNCSSLTSINVDANNANYCSIDGVLFSKDKTTLIQYPIGNTRSEYIIPNSVTSIGYGAFSGCSLDSMYFKSDTPPATSEDALAGSTIAAIYVPHNSLEEYKAAPLLKDHISKIVSGYVPETCTSLTATASDVQYGQLTTTTITWEAVTSGHDRCTGELIENITLTGTSISDEFELNLSEADSIERTIPFTYLGTTVECTFTQGPFIPKSYTINLNNSWELQPTNSNPNIEEYEGVYQSFSNKGKNNTAAIMYLDLVGYDTFTIYVRSYGESNYDYIMVGQPNTTITNNTSYSNTSLVKAHTMGKATSLTGLSSYTAVTFTGLDMCTTSRIPIVYRKDSSSSTGDDRGYLLIPKNL